MSTDELYDGADVKGSRSHPLGFVCVEQKTLPFTATGLHWRCRYMECHALRSAGVCVVGSHRTMSASRFPDEPL